MSRWQDNPEDELDDEEIARILQEEEYEIARQQQREAQLRQQQAAKQTPTLKHDGKSVVASSSGDEVLLLQSRCSAVSGSTVLNGSCYLYRNMFKFVCVERGKEVDVSIPIVTIEFISPVCAVLSKETGAVPGIRSPGPQGSAVNALQLYTQDKRIHTFFKFADNKSFEKILSILSSIHKNNTPAVLPQTPPAPVATLPPPPPATTAVAVPPPMGMHMYPGMYPPAPYYAMPPPTVAAASPGTAAAQSDFQQLHQQMARLQIQQPSLPPTDASGHQQPPAMYYPYPPMTTAAPLPPAAAPAVVPGSVVSSGPEGSAPVPGALPPMPYYYYYPPPPVGGEFPAYPPPYAPYLPYGGLPPAYVAPPGQAPVQQQPQQQQPQPPPPMQSTQQAPAPSGPPKEDLLA